MGKNTSEFAYKLTRKNALETLQRKGVLLIFFLIAFRLIIAILHVDFCKRETISNKNMKTSDQGSVQHFNLG